jgi:hypothetical protein
MTQSTQTPRTIIALDLGTTTGWGNRSKTAGNMARYAFVALCLLFAQTWQRWRTIWARCGTGWAPLMFNLSPR